MLWSRLPVMLNYRSAVFISSNPYCNSYKTMAKNCGMGKPTFYRKCVRMAGTLTFLPATDIIKGFELLEDCNDDSDVRVFGVLWEDLHRSPPTHWNWQVAPRFAVSEWNVFQAIMDWKSKTNNNVGVEQNFESTLTELTPTSKIHWKMRS